MMHMRARHWTVALTAALLVHAGVVAGAVWQPSNRSSGGGGVGIEISLSAAGGAPSSAAEPMPAAAAPEPETPPPAEPVETEVTPPPPVETVPDEVVDVVEEPDVPPPPEPMEEPVVVEEPPEEPPPEPMEEPVVVEEAIIEPPPEPVEVDPVIEMAEVTPVEEVADTQPVPVPPPPRRRPTPPPAPQPSPAAEPAAEPVQQLASVPDASEEPVAGEEAPTSQVAGIANAPASAISESAEEATGGVSGAAMDYMSALQAWLERHKEYPRRARLRRQEGTALLYFVIDRSGRVLEARLQQTSGHDLLDRAVMTMIERAQPLPSMPDEMRDARLELVVPIEFFLR